MCRQDSQSQINNKRIYLSATTSTLNNWFPKEIAFLRLYYYINHMKGAEPTVLQQPVTINSSEYTENIFTQTQINNHATIEVY